MARGTHTGNGGPGISYGVVMAVAALVIALLAAVAAGVAAWYAASQAKGTQRAVRASEASAEASHRAAEASERAAKASERAAGAGGGMAAPEPEHEELEEAPETGFIGRGKENQGRLRLRSASDGRGRRLILENLSSAIVTDVACEVIAVPGDAKSRLPRIGAFGAAELHLGESASSDPYDPTVGWPRMLECRVRWSDGLGPHDERMDVNVLQG